MTKLGMRTFFFFFTPMSGVLSVKSMLILALSSDMQLISLPLALSAPGVCHYNLAGG